jgi:predicted Rossmann fold flavoprotein
MHQLTFHIAKVKLSIAYVPCQRAMMANQEYDAIILGAGGAGLLCAATAGQRGRRVLVIDHASDPGKKILISGGGRCNFTNVNATTQHAQQRYLSANPHFAKSALGRYTPQDFIALVDSHGIAHHEKTLGQLFCDGSARQIVEMLLDECDKASGKSGHVDFAFNAPIGEVTHNGSSYRVAYNGQVANAASLVIATGGPSIPKMGATSFAYDLARQFGLKVVEPRPALVPFTLGGDDVLFRELSGVSADVIAHCGGTAFAEAALLTHKGLSGPAILQISSYWRHGQSVELDFLPQMEAGWLRALKRSHPRSTIKSVLSGMLSSRLADTLADRIAANHGGIGGNLADTQDRVLEGIERSLSRWAFHPNGTEGYAKAEVTLGGISTAELSQQTMETKRVPGLFVIGEAVDVTGWLGGYNFQWAWASGVAAGEVV